MVKKKSKSRSKLAKRAQNALEIAEKELEGNGSGNDDGYESGDGDGHVVNLLKKVQGTGGEESGEESFEDEELDSDEALGSDDDYDVLNSKMSQTIRDRRKNNAGSLSGDEEGYTSIDEEELVPLSQVWDMDEERDSSGGEDVGGKLQLQSSGDELSAESSEESSSDDEDEEREEDPFDEISEDEEDVELSTITKDLLRETDSKRNRKLDNFGSGKDSEYTLPSNNNMKRLNLADMMEVIEDKEAAASARLIQKDSAAVAVPLPQRIQERHNRKAAYEISKQEVEKWQDVVQQNRRAEHLSFPMNAPGEQNHASAFTRSTEQPRSELQEKVDKVLEDSNLVEDQKNATFEELATAKMSPEEMKKRTAELRLMRELMFREERKAKRLKKIKSKTYRRIKKKEMLRNREMAGLSDESDDDQEAARAKERMTLKHRANSKWSKDMFKHGMANDQETREEIEEMLKQGERLKQKILDRGSESEQDARLTDIEDEDHKISEDVPLRENVGKTGVMNMAFMKNAEARERENNKELIASLRAMETEGDEEQAPKDERLFDDGFNIQINKGRRIYTPGVNESKSDPEKDKQTTTKVEAEITEEQATELPRDQSTEKQVRSDEPNPWLGTSDDENDTNVVRSAKVSIVGKDSSKLVKSAKKIEKVSDRQQEKSAKKAQRDEDLLLDLNDTNRLQLVDPYGDPDDDSNSFMFKQQESIAEAFAGDEVVDNFEEEKKRMAIDEDDKEEDVTLPGWGEWAGAGANPTKKRKFVKKIKGVASKDKRKDKNLKNVIINERANKKSLKYQSSAVPFPYENREQYERSLRMPIGQEWTSRASHQKMIKPRILTKPSHVISPLKAPFK
ncbi:hypothetical protein HG537_0G00400 [Torulaspora globosa]|uniref:U3 small nucleolar RNA-associated protein 14 n=1 Tax=Torulaspora globosa TaxID=48254 RepID=A0A7H9HYW4_9SACH|nr:hypothetical protein HG537_0G00400 [Torulaspora sp. CBS 2947]